MTARSLPDPVDALVAAARTENAPTAAQHQAVLQLLELWLARRGLSPADLDDVCAEAVLRLVRVAKAGELDPERPPGAWLRVVADHLALDVLRRNKRRSGGELSEALSDPRAGDRLAALLDSSAAATDVERALRLSGDANDHEAVRAVASWLSLAEADGEAPSTRQVGERLGVSHMTVQRALRRFGERLSQ